MKFYKLIIYYICYDNIIFHGNFSPQSQLLVNMLVSGGTTTVKDQHVWQQSRMRAEDANKI